jgi:hypothetical protein
LAHNLANPRFGRKSKARVATLMIIDGYSISGYWYLLMAIGAYSIGGYWCLLMAIGAYLLVDIVAY